MTFEQPISTTTADNVPFAPSAATTMVVPLSFLSPAIWKELKRFLKYGLVGVLGAVVDFGVLNALIFWAGWSSDSGKFMANLISTTVAIISNYIWNRLWTFPEARNQKKRVQLVQFSVVALIGLVINTAIFYLTNQYLFERFLSETLAIQLAKATAIGIVMFCNFGINRLWTFREINTMNNTEELTPA